MTNKTRRAMWRRGTMALMMEFNTTCKPERRGNKNTFWDVLLWREISVGHILAGWGSGEEMWPCRTAEHQWKKYKDDISIRSISLKNYFYLYVYASHIGKYHPALLPELVSPGSWCKCCIDVFKNHPQGSYVHHLDSSSRTNRTTIH